MLCNYCGTFQKGDEVCCELCQEPFRASSSTDTPDTTSSKDTPDTTRLAVSINDSFYREQNYVLVDELDHEELRHYIWAFDYNSNYIFLFWEETPSSYVKKLENKGYRNGEKVWLHRLIMNCPKGMEVDHINHNTCDNTRSNLRICTPFQNKCNIRISHGGRGDPERYRGVSAVGLFKYKARIEIEEGKFKDLGTFKTEKEAVKAYNLAALSHHKEYAQFNHYADRDPDWHWGYPVFIWGSIAALIYYNW